MYNNAFSMASIYEVHGSFPYSLKYSHLECMLRKLVLNYNCHIFRHCFAIRFFKYFFLNNKKIIFCNLMHFGKTENHSRYV